MKEIKYEKLTLEYSESESVLTVTDCEKDAVSVVIPKEIDGTPVVAIGEKAFYGCDQLVSVALPENEEFFSGEKALFGFDIGDGAFAGCRSLKLAKLPLSLSTIGHGAFRECESLEEIFIPDCYVGPYAFCRCYSLKRVNPIDVISDGVFSHCKSLEVFPVKDGTDTIGEDAFEHCYALTNAVIPASVERIEGLAFRNCRGLKTVTFLDPDDWYGSSRYSSISDYELDLSAPAHNAYCLRTMDFDDGCLCWYKK